ncbi:MAG: sensor histidine kinase KdpD [Gammaproteobacteria bacterium]
MNKNNENRPNPDDLLKKIQEENTKEQKGKLKIYLGAAPGVGKTYAMLKQAIHKRAQGVDIVAGIIESHGRKEIDQMLDQIEILPKKQILYKDKEILDFDLDFALERRPSIILMDEMAHTNAPSLRHRKRWQDIEELLTRGIDVHTTLNVQHIESFNDIVSQILQIRVKETVPDLLLEKADSIELVDLPPEELIKRLQDGKVYFPEQAKLAKDNFFKKGNLIALRELALKVTSENVNAQALSYRKIEGIKKIWPIKQKILVCVGPREDSMKLIRVARRMAIGLACDWIAIYVDTLKNGFSKKTKINALKNLRFAEQLGAKTQIIYGFDLVEEIIKFAREENITQIMLFKHIRPRIVELFFKSLADELIRCSS